MQVRLGEELLFAVEKKFNRVYVRWIAWYKTGAYIVSSFKKRGRTVQPDPSWFGLSNYNNQWVDSPTSRKQQQLSSVLSKTLNQVYNLLALHLALRQRQAMFMWTFIVLTPIQLDDKPASAASTKMDDEDSSRTMVPSSCRQIKH